MKINILIEEEAKCNELAIQNKKTYKGAMNKEKQVKLHNNQINANMHNLSPRKAVKKYIFFSVMNLFPGLPYTLLTRGEIIWQCITKP